MKNGCRLRAMVSKWEGNDIWFLYVINFYLAKIALFLHAHTTDVSDIFGLIFSRVNSFCNLVFSRHKALSCNFAIYRGAQCLQKIWDD